MIQLQAPRRTSITSGSPKSHKGGKLVDYSKEIGSKGLHSALIGDSWNKRSGGDKVGIRRKGSEGVKKESILKVLDQASNPTSTTSKSKNQDTIPITFRLRKRTGTDAIGTEPFLWDDSCHSGCSESQETHDIRFTREGPTRSSSLGRRSYHSLLLDSSTNHFKSVFLPSTNSIRNVKKSDANLDADTKDASPDSSSKNETPSGLPEEGDLEPNTTSERFPTKPTKQPVRKSKSFDARAFDDSEAALPTTTKTASSNPSSLTSRRRMLLQNSKRNQSMRLLSSSTKKDSIGSNSDHSTSLKGSSNHGNSHGIGGRRGQLLRQGSFVSGTRIRTLN